MTRDEVLEEAAQALEVVSHPWVPESFVSAPFAMRVRSLKSKPPEKPPEVESPSWERWVGPCSHGRDPWTRCETCWAAGETQALAWRVGQLAHVEIERNALRRELPQFDCRRTGGSVSDSGGDHCPPEAPCMRCRLRRAEEKLEAQTKAAGEAVARVEALTAELSHERWVKDGAPMPGETP